MFYPTDGSSNLLSNAGTYLTNSWHHNPDVHLPQSSYSFWIGPKFISTPSVTSKCCHNMYTTLPPPQKKKTKYVSSLSFIVFKFTSVLEAPHLLQECTDVFISSQHVWFQASSMLSMRSSLYTSVTTILQCITFQKSKDLILMVLANVQQLQLNTQMSRLMLPSLQLLHHHIHPVNLMHFQVVFKTSGSLIFYT